MHIQELAQRLGARVDPSADVEIRGAATLEDAGPGDVTFLSNPRYAGQLKETRASAVFVSPDVAEETPAVKLALPNPYLAFARALRLFYEPPGVPPGVHPTAILGEDVVLGADVAVGAYAVVGDGARIGDRSVIHPHAVIYAGATLGSDCVVHSLAVVREHVRVGNGVILQNGAVVGGDGFGFAPRGDGTWEKIPQTGIVTLADDVEVQANAAIDRATVGATTVGRGTKIDNLVQIGHGCRVGEDSLLCGQSGLAGSTTIGNRVTLAGQAGVAGHCSVADDVTVGAQAGVAGTIAKAGTYVGSPTLDIDLFKRVTFYWARLPELVQRLKALEKKVP